MFCLTQSLLFLGSNVVVSLAYEWGQENEYARMAHLHGAVYLLGFTTDQLGGLFGIEVQDLRVSVLFLLLNYSEVSTKPLHTLSMQHISANFIEQL